MVALFPPAVQACCFASLDNFAGVVWAEAALPCIQPVVALCSGTWDTNPADSTTDATRRTTRLLMGSNRAPVLPTALHMDDWEGRCCAPLRFDVAGISNLGNV